MSKPAKPAATGDQPPKSKKMLIIIIAVVVLLAGGGGAAFFLMKPSHPAKQDQAAEGEEVAAGDHDEEEAPHDAVLPPKFVEIGTFTANLMQEEGDRYLQVAITLKLSKPELEEKLKANNPEVLHRINMLLQSKRPSELATVVGKEKLANDIKAQVEYVMGLRKTAPVVRATQPAVEGEEAPSEHAETSHSKKGIAEVLFTSFIIQ